MEMACPREDVPGAPTAYGPEAHHQLFEAMRWFPCCISNRSMFHLCKISGPRVMGSLYLMMSLRYTRDISGAEQEVEKITAEDKEAKEQPGEDPTKHI